MKEVKLFGLQRTGTCYLQLLLKDNYKVKVYTNYGGWKHGEYNVKGRIGRELDCIVISKNIYSWLISMYKWEAKKKGNFFQYIKVTTYRWNERYQSWLSVNLEKCSIFFIKYEDLFQCPEETLSSIAKNLGWKKKQKHFIDISTVIRANAIRTSIHFDKDYYANQTYLQRFTKKMKLFIKKNIDLKVVKLLGYDERTLL